MGLRDYPPGGEKSEKPGKTEKTGNEPPAAIAATASATVPAVRSRLPRRELTVFCVAVALALGTVAGAVAAKRPAGHGGPALATIRVAGKSDVLSDPALARQLRDAGWTLDSQGYGAKDIEQTVPLNRYDMAYLPTQNAAQVVLDKLDAEGAPDQEYVPYQSRLAIASYQNVAELLQRAGIASRHAGGIWTFDLRAYVKAVDNGLRWEGIAGNTKGEKYRSAGRVLVHTTDPRHAAQAELFAAQASYALNGYNAVTTPGEVQNAAGKLGPIFANQGGAMKSGGDPAWNAYLSGDSLTEPLVLIYENKFVGAELTHDPRIRPDMVLMYPTPDITVANALIGITTQGNTVSRLIVNDVRQFAERKYGYFTGNIEDFRREMAGQDIAVAGQLPEAIPPQDDVLKDLVSRVP